VSAVSANEIVTVRVGVFKSALGAGRGGGGHGGGCCLL
jgi:hypothetical protein